MSKKTASVAPGDRERIRKVARSNIAPGKIFITRFEHIEL